MSLVDGIRDLLNRLSPPRNLNRLSGLFGYTLVALSENQKVKMGVSVGGVPYNVKALDTFNQYDLCAVVGVESTNYLKIVKPFKTRTEIVDLISLITEISNITSIDLVDKITLIDTITSIASIGTIQKIDLLKLAYIRNAPRIMNGGFETSDEAGWTFNGANVIGSQYFSGAYSAEILTVSGYVEQVLEYPIQCKYIIELSAKAMTTSGLPVNVCRFLVTYTDGTTDFHDFSPVIGWINMDMTPHLDVAKTLLAVKLIRQSGTLSIFVDNVLVIDTEPRVLTETANIDIVAQTLANLDINIKAQSVDLDIKTSGGTNIVIDKLTQTAYTSRDALIRNDNGVTTPTAPPNTQTNVKDYGKWFPMGMRGIINRFYIYCKRTGAGTLTLSYSPHPNMGAIGSITITPDASWNWKSNTIRQMWNYDSIFIWVSACSADVSWGYDTEETDTFKTSDDGVTWEPQTYRLFIYIDHKGLPVGVLPVSGTLNTVEIPHSSQERLYETNTELPLAETTIKEVFGTGHTEYIEAWVSAKANSDDTRLKIYCDGVLTFYWTFYSLNDIGYSASTPRISLLKFAEDGFCSVHITLKFGFLRSLKITMESVTTADQNIAVEGLVNLIK